MQKTNDSPYSLLFDPDFYAKAAGRRFWTKGGALRHYLKQGERRNLDPSPFFQTAHYRAQMDPGEKDDGALQHYLTRGYRRGLNPTPYFEQDWYAWQNPDHAVISDNAYLHYLTKGRSEGRDPAPQVDMVRYRDMVGPPEPGSSHYEMILGGVRAPALGVYQSWDDMQKAQTQFRDAIRVHTMKDRVFRAPRPFLVFLQCGPQSRHREWFKDQGRNWDLLVNYYDYRGYDPDIGDYVFFQAGTKFTAIHFFLREYGNLLAQYEYILFLDDDILVSTEDLNRLFDICRNHDLDLAQMSLSSNSQCIWQVFFNQPGRALRRVSGVEIMMPVYSRKALQKAADGFALSVSGFGLDLLSAKRVQNMGKNNIAVIDEVVARHEKPIDQNAGGYYSYLRSNHINAKAELWYLIKTFGLGREFQELA